MLATHYLFDPRNPFSIFDILIVFMFLFMIVAPKRFYKASKFPPEHSPTWLPRVRPLGIAGLVLLVVGRFVMFKLLPSAPA
jgi:hypothetical protein